MQLALCDNTGVMKIFDLSLYKKISFIFTSSSEIS